MIRHLSPMLTLLVCNAASAAVLISNEGRDFGGGTDGSPFNSSVYDINSPTAVVETDGTAQSPFSLTGIAPVDIKGILLTNSTSLDTPQAGATFTAGSSITVPYYMQFDYRAISFASSPGLLFAGSSGTNAINLHMSGATGIVQVNQGSGFANLSGMQLVLDDWYRFTLTINPLNATNDTFGLRVQSLESTTLDLTATGLNFQNDTTSLFTNFRFQFNTGASTNTGQYAVDNVRFTDNASTLVFAVIPEPSAALLGGIGMLCLLRRRR